LLLHRLLAVAATVVAITSFSTGLAGAVAERTAQASASAHAITVRGRPFFPVMLIDQCSRGAASRARSLGVNLIINESCGVLAPGRQLLRIQGASLGVLPIHARRAVKGRALVGWTYPDEPENNGWTPARLQRAQPYARGSDDGLLSFVTTSAGFFHKPYRDTRVAPLVYRRFAQLADVAGFDLYPLGHCSNDLTAVYDAQRAFVRLAGAMPTFQWIETGPIRPTYCGGFQMSPAQLRAEVWLAIAGGARGIGYFTHTWSPNHSAFDVSLKLQRTIKKTSDQLAAVRPGLLGSTVLSGANSGNIKVVARRSGDRVYVFAVNAQPSQMVAQVTVPRLGDGRLQVFGEKRSTTVRDHRFIDTWKPLAVHVYVQRGR